MMKKFTKGISILLAAAMAATSMAGCASTPAASSSSASSEGSSSTSSASSAAEESSAGAGEAAPLSGKITVEVFDRGVTGGSDVTNNFWTDWIKENFKAETGVDVEFVSVPRSEEIPKLNVLMASNTAPDISYTYTTSVVYNYYKNGGLADLSSALENYGQGLLEYLGDDVLQYGQFNGQQVAIPAKRISLAINMMYIRKDWLDKLGMEMPTTKEEFHQALIAFKEQDPGGVGLDRVIPMEARSDVLACFSPIIESFLNLSLDDRTIAMNAIDDNPVTLDGFKDAIQWINQLYNEGLINPEFPLYKDQVQTDANMMSGISGAYNANYDYPLRTSPGMITELKKVIPDAELVPIDCFENPHMDNRYMKKVYGPAGLLMFVPATSQNVDGAIAYLDWLCKDDVRNFLTCGEEGVHHTLDENGIPVMQAVEGDKIMNSPNNLDYALIVNGVDLGDEEKNIEVLSKSYDVGLEDIYMDAYEKATTDGFIYPRIATPIDAEAQFSANLKEKIKEVLCNAITASPDQFDAVYEAGMQEYLAMGGQQCLDERAQRWDEEHPEG